MEQAGGRTLVKVGGSDPDVVPPRAPNRGSGSDVLMRKHDEQMEVRVLLERSLGRSLSIVVLQNRLGVHNLDLAHLLHLGIIQPPLEACLPRDAKPGRMGLHQPDSLHLLVSLRTEELCDGHHEFLKLGNVVSHANTGWRIVGRRRGSDAGRSDLGSVKSLHRFAKENPVEC